MATLQKCGIKHCTFVVCPKCHHWFDSAKPPKEHSSVCHERATPARKLLPYDPGCRRGFSYHGDKSYAEIDASIDRHLKLGERLVHVKAHPKRPAKRKQRQVRSTRSTNAARPTTET